MEDKELNNINNKIMYYGYRAGGTKYYFLTGGSGYPLAEFMTNLPGNIGPNTGLVIPENRPMTVNIAPGSEHK